MLAKPTTKPEEEEDTGSFAPQLIPIAPESVMYSIELLGIEIDGCKVMVIVLAVLLAMELPSVIFGLEAPRLPAITPDATVLDCS